WERQIASIEGATHIPLHELPERLSELDGRREIVAFCHRGQRSRLAVALLRAAGFHQVRNLSGGIDAWSEAVEWGKGRY
ncbi:MAG TPA: rhodanese-like domain-containing protein, partial [Gemmatimonadales bacterium]|nr:rhodanese-like domain-containing protein [Gemmatimonadales bacterium]